MEYFVRQSAGESEKKYSLSEDALVIKDLKTEFTQTLPFNNIKSIHLKFISRRNLADVYVCKIKSLENKTFQINSLHYSGIAKFKNKGESYSPFIIEFHKKLGDRNIKYIKGDAAFIYWSSMISYIAVGVAAFAFAITHLIPFGIIVMVLLVFIAYRLTVHYGNNKPGRYSPLNIPEEVLP